MIKEDYGHWHVDYYNEEIDFFTSATGFYNEKGTWDVFFEEYSKEDLHKISGSNCKINKDFGALLFEAIDYNNAHEKFSKWVVEILLPYIKANPDLKTRDT
ncbi:DUF3986 family protein [Priestia megaterium]|uniref:DUF3986 family protein n=1 Tax=Priestia megaterium TaxID=1404 RepID=UPI0025B1AB35|nr:DUF3986 family protein [Priestia megaterium]MDN3232883.1 DUF3986 family protein [Priestia megaterium]